MKLPTLKRESRDDILDYSAPVDVTLISGNGVVVKEDCYHGVEVRMSQTVSRGQDADSTRSLGDDTGGLLKRLLTQSWPSTYSHRNSGDLKLYMDDGLARVDVDAQNGGDLPCDGRELTTVSCIPSSMVCDLPETSSLHQLPHPRTLIRGKSRMKRERKVPQSLGTGDAIKRHLLQLHNKNSLCVSDSMLEGNVSVDGITTPGCGIRKRYRLATGLHTDPEAATSGHNTVLSGLPESTQSGKTLRPDLQSNASFHMNWEIPLMSSTPIKTGCSELEGLMEQDYKPRNIFPEPVEADHPPRYIDMIDMTSFWSREAPESHSQSTYNTGLTSDAALQGCGEKQFGYYQPGYTASNDVGNPTYDFGHPGYTIGQSDYDPDLGVGELGYDVGQPGRSPDLPEDGQIYNNFTKDTPARKQRQSDIGAAHWLTDTYVDSDRPDVLQTYNLTGNTPGRFKAGNKLTNKNGCLHSCYGDGTPSELYGLDDDDANIDLYGDNGIDVEPFTHHGDDNSNNGIHYKDILVG